MRTVVVTGIGLASALGENREATWQALLAGRSAIRCGRPFLDLPPLPLARFPAPPPGTLAALGSTLALAALADARLSVPQPQCGIVVGSSRSDQHQWEVSAREGFGRSHPTSWLACLPGGAARGAAAALQSAGPLLAPAVACATGLHAIARGAALIREGTCDRVIAGAVELPITPLTLAGFLRMGAYAKTGCYPFSRHREGLVLGEGGALFALEALETARQRGARAYGAILGEGLTCDARHYSAPAPEGGMRAIELALARSGCRPDEIDYIHAHGTSTPRNDANEAGLVRAMGLDRVAISSTKGATGHTLGASGALGTAFCLLAQRDRCLPPCTGLGNAPAFDLDWVGAARSAAVDRALCLSFGFGGQNAAVVVGRLT